MNSLTSNANSNRSQYDLAFQVSPIILNGGIVGSQGSLAPITNYTGDTASGAPLLSLDNAFAHFVPMPGSTLISQSIGMYPFANQAVAANATIQQPLTISLMMIAPVNRAGGYLKKLSIFSNLQRQLANHNAIGGTYIVATPAFIYNFMLMTAMTDMTPEPSLDGEKQVQIIYQLDFIQPILTLTGLAAAQSAVMQKITNGNQFVGPPSPSGNTASSPANLSGVTGALGNVVAAVSSFGGTLGGPQ